MKFYQVLALHDTVTQFFSIVYFLVLNMVFYETFSSNITPKKFEEIISVQVLNTGKHCMT